MKNKIFLSIILMSIFVLPSYGGKKDDTEKWLQKKQSDYPLIPTYPNSFNYGHPWILVGVKTQSLIFYDEFGLEKKRYVVSTAKNGVGEIKNTYKTPRGRHRICQKIGENAPIRTIISRREVTPWVYTEELHQTYPTKDWILTRIMWLCGMEPGFNQGGDVDSFERFIYIHGAGDHTPWGTPASLGCVRMKNEDVIELFELSPMNTDVFIDENL